MAAFFLYEFSSSCSRGSACKAHAPQHNGSAWTRKPSREATFAGSRLDEQWDEEMPMQPLCVFPRQILQSTSVTVMMLGSFCAAWAGDQPGQERVPNAFFPMNFERHDLELASSLKLQARLLQELGYRGHARRPEVGRLRPPRRRQSPSRFACGRGVDDTSGNTGNTCRKPPSSFTARVRLQSSRRSHRLHGP